MKLFSISRERIVLLASLIPLGLAASVLVGSGPTLSPNKAAGMVGKQRLLSAYSRLPLSFEANRGQTDAQVQFLSRGSGYTLFLNSTEAVLALRQPDILTLRLHRGHCC